jgi:acetamidase/formamidase
MARHRLEATCKTVHLGGFSHQLEPALRVDSGDTVHVETYTGFYICDQAPPEFLTPEFMEICKHLPPERKAGDGQHLLTGPIYVRGAEPGDVLEVKLEEISPGVPVGYNLIRPGWGALPEKFNQRKLRFLPLDLENHTAEFPPQSGIKIPLNPFFGILGVAPKEMNHSSTSPGIHGGNLDNKELQAGSRVFLPVFVPGALFSIGDGHSAQGDGEVDVTAIETSMNGTIQFNLHKNHKLTAPIAETPTDWITMGFGDTLDKAFQAALKQMIVLLERLGGLSEEDAYVLCSVAVNFRITQVVNRPLKGVHGMIPKSILPGPLVL